MINKVTIKNSSSESIVLEMRNPEQSGFFIKSIKGLGPVKATINTTQALSLDGSRFNSAKLTERNIVFGLGFLEKPTIEDSRQRSYKYFPIKGLIEITIETNNRTIKTVGYVESNEPDIFSKEESSVVSVICPDPYLYDEHQKVVNFSSVVNQFEFPFSNESLSENLIIFSNLLTESQHNILYTGDSPVGFQMYIHAIGLVTNLTIYNLLTRVSMTIDSDILETMTGEPLDSGDDILISTRKGNKFITLYRDGEAINILNSLGTSPEWLTLEKGDNTIYYTADFGTSNVIFRVEHDVLYEGV